MGCEYPGPVGGVRESRTDSRTLSGRRDPQHVPLLQGELRGLERRPLGSPPRDADSLCFCLAFLLFTFSPSLLSHKSITDTSLISIPQHFIRFLLIIVPQVRPGSSLRTAVSVGRALEVNSKVEKVQNLITPSLSEGVL